MMAVEVMDVVQCGIPVMAAFAYQRKLLTVDGALAAIPVGVAISHHGATSFLMLALFFVLGSLATKVAARWHTHRREGDTDAKKGRNAMQVLATGGIPALFCFGMSTGHLDSNRWEAGYFAYLACALGDTLASEIGQLARACPRLISSFAIARPGRDGAVSLLGTVMSLIGGGLVGLAHGTCAGVLQGAMYGAMGSILDSWLGLLLQPPSLVQRAGTWAVLNVLVNVLSGSALSAVVTAAAGTGYESAMSVSMWAAVIFVVLQLLLLRSPVAADYSRLLCGGMLLAWYHTDCITAVLQMLPLPVGCCNSTVTGSHAPTEQEAQHLLSAVTCALLFWAIGLRDGSVVEAVVAVGCLCTAFFTIGQCPCFVAAIREALPTADIAAVVDGLLPATILAISSSSSSSSSSFTSSSSTGGPRAPGVTLLAAAMLFIQPMARIMAQFFRSVLVKVARARDRSRTPNEVFVVVFQALATAALYVYVLAHWRAIIEQDSSKPTATASSSSSSSASSHVLQAWTALRVSDVVSGLLVGTVAAFGNLYPITTFRDGLVSFVYTRCLSSL